MGFNDRDNNRRPSYNSGGQSGGVSRHGAKNLTSVTCFTCGNACKVPFVPSAGKPVYCNDCFRKNDSYSERSDRPDRSSSARYSDRNRSDSRSQSSQSTPSLTEINAKLDKIISLLED